jgi:hypothetical protein
LILKTFRNILNVRLNSEVVRELKLSSYQVDARHDGGMLPGRKIDLLIEIKRRLGYVRIGLKERWIC